MAFHIKRIKITPQTYHIGTYALPSEHAISVHVETGAEKPRWIYSEDPQGLKPEDLAYWAAEIAPTLDAALKKKQGENRHRARALRIQTKRTFT